MMRGTRATALALHVALACVPCASSALHAQGIAQPRSYEARLSIGGRQRSYLVDLPPKYDGHAPLPVVIVFHGGGGSASGIRTQTGMSDLARSAGFIAVYPNGTGPLRDRLLTWNDESCCGSARKQHVDDVAFVRAMLDTIEATLAVDRARVFATGMSNGGMMSYLVGCRLADRFAAIAPVSGELTVGDCKPPRPVSVLAIHGTADENLPFDGGIGRKALDRHDVRSVSFAIDTWRRADHCPDVPVVARSEPVVNTTYAPCANGTTVELLAITGGAHAWPGGQRMARFLDSPSTALDATKTVWEFFAAHPRH